MPLIPPVAILPPAQSPQPASEAPSSPLSEPPNSLPDIDQLEDEKDEDAVTLDDIVNAPLSPPDTASQLFDDPMPVDSQEPDAPKSPLDSASAPSPLDSVPALIDPALSVISTVPQLPTPPEVSTNNLKDETIANILCSQHLARPPFQLRSRK
jgi:hypothetical protein